jgi:formylglycine-generating enzyme required for sulfatase activity
MGMFYLMNKSSSESKSTSAGVSRYDSAVPANQLKIESNHPAVLSELHGVAATARPIEKFPSEKKPMLLVPDSLKERTEEISTLPVPEMQSTNKMDSAYVFPKLTEKEIKENQKQKKKMIEQLAKFSSDKYALIPMGTFNYKGEEVSLHSFYMETSEVTNLEYRTFLYDLLINERKDEFLEAKPDQKQWRKEFDRPFLQPMVDNYFSHPAYNTYPVVNISREGAEMYCAWLTIEANKYLTGKGKPLINDVRIPADVEWSYAATGGIQDAVYPWNSKMIDKTYSNAHQKVRNHRGCFLANFCLRKYSEKMDTTSECSKEKGKYKSAYTSAGYMLGYEVFTVPVYSYNPNDYGLYCMSGNVAEMVKVTTDKGNKTIGIGTKGGSWNSSDQDVKIMGKDEYAGKADPSPFIGFRPVISKKPFHVKMDN